MTDRNTKSGVNKQLVRRLAKVRGWKYTSALRILEPMEHQERIDYVETFENAAKIAEEKA